MACQPSKGVEHLLQWFLTHLDLLERLLKPMDVLLPHMQIFMKSSMQQSLCFTRRSPSPGVEGAGVCPPRQQVL